MQLKKIGLKSRSGNLAEGDNLKIKYKTNGLNLLFSDYVLALFLKYYLLFWALVSFGWC